MTEGLLRWVQSSWSRCLASISRCLFRGDLRSSEAAGSGDPRRAQLLPIAGELQGALADGGAEGLVGGEGVEPFGLRLALVTLEVNQTQGLTLLWPVS